MRVYLLLHLVATEVKRTIVKFENKIYIYTYVNPTHESQYQHYQATNELIISGMKRQNQL